MDLFQKIFFSPGNNIQYAFAKYNLAKKVKKKDTVKLINFLQK